MKREKVKRTGSERDMTGRNKRSEGKKEEEQINRKRERVREMGSGRVRD